MTGRDSRFDPRVILAWIKKAKIRWEELCLKDKFLAFGAIQSGAFPSERWTAVEPYNFFIIRTLCAVLNDRYKGDMPMPAAPGQHEPPDIHWLPDLLTTRMDRYDQAVETELCKRTTERVHTWD